MMTHYILYDSYLPCNDHHQLSLRLHCITGKRHPATLQTMNNLANTYKMEGKYMDAELLYIDCLEKMKSALGSNHPDTLQTMNNLANNYSRQDNHEDAEEMYRDCYEKMSVILGEGGSDRGRE